MASSAFDLDDQTDEDFFDKLIDDEDIDFSRYKGSSVAKVELDVVVKEVEKLSVSDVDASDNAGSKVDGGKGMVVGELSDPKKEALTSEGSEASALVAEGEGGDVDGRASTSGVVVDDELGNGNGVMLAQLDIHQDHVIGEGSKLSVAEIRDEVVEDEASNVASATEGKGEETAVAGVVSKSAVSEGTGVKVVQWSSFHSDAFVGTGRGSYSDFFSEVADNSEDPFENLDNTGQSNGLPENSSAFPSSSYGQQQEDPFANLGNTGNFVADAVLKTGALTSTASGFHTSGYVQYQEDPFANLGSENHLGAESNVSTGAIENSVPDLGASVYGNHQENPSTNLGYTNYAGAEYVGNGLLQNSASDLATSRSSSYEQHQEGQNYVDSGNQNLDGQEFSNQNWENLYPGWKYDPTTQQWYQLEGYVENSSTNAAVNTSVNSQESSNVNYQSAETAGFSAQEADAPYSQQAVEAVSQSMNVASETSTVSTWDQSYGNSEYPAHMVFDPQYPGWYYDTIENQWRELESSAPNFNQSTSVVYDQQQLQTNVENNISQSMDNHQIVSNFGVANSTYDQQSVSTWQPEKQESSQFQPFTQSIDQSTPSVVYNPQYKNTNVDNLGSQSPIIQQNVSNRDGSMATYDQQNTSVWYTQNDANGDTVGYTEKHAFSPMSQQTWFSPGSTAFQQDPSRTDNISSGIGGFQISNHANFSQPQVQTKVPNQVTHFSPSNFGSQMPVQFFQQPHQNGTQFSHDGREGRSSAGRPAHALVTFGFGGKLIVMKHSSSLNANQTYGSQGHVEGVINILNLMDVVMEKSEAANLGTSGCDYFSALCQQSFPGPLAGGSVGNKELNKWIDGKIVNCKSSDVDFNQGDHMRLLLSLLKISWQFYGKLRSPFGTDQRMKETDCPESVLARLFASAERSDEYGALQQRCIHNLPSETQLQATALEVQKLLVSGRKDEALQCAQVGQLWGPALVIALQLGDQFYCDTVKHMALNQLVAGSPLRTLCLLIAGKHADVFSAATANNSFPYVTNMPPQHEQVGANYMLDEWKENLAILTANRTVEDEKVITHLGDSLWKDRGQVTAAHMCYLIAEAELQKYSDSSRLCLIGADHWQFPRTYASPEAIQRTELYEYSKVVGNPQFLLEPFQPYKLIYAHMLAEVGKLADALKYCQAILKALKTGRTPEVDIWRELVSSLEERIRAHQQGGYSINLAPTKLIGKLRTFLDTTHRVVGGLPPPVPSTAPGFAYLNEQAIQPGNPNVPNSRSTMAMSSLMPSASMEPLSERTSESNQLNMPNRSISEPDFGKSPNKDDSSKKVDSSTTQRKTSASSGSRFGFGSQLLQKIGGLVKSRSDKQAKLGEANKFYYDEKLKRWVEEGAEPPAEEAALPPPPPMTAAIQNRVQDYNVNDALQTSSFNAVGGPETNSPVPSLGSGSPPVPPSSNQFSARGRSGVHSRYVDTFNKGGSAPGNFSLASSLPAAKPTGGSNPKFFIPSPVTSSNQEMVQTSTESIQDAFMTNNDPPKSVDTFSTPPPSTPLSMSMQRFPSMDNIVQKRAGDSRIGSGFIPPESRRVASWSGSLNEARNPSTRNETTPTSVGMSPLSYMPSATPSMQSQRSSGSFGDDLQEVEL